ncbi:hypothetical protein BGZ63DRAFT_420306 [Mariannaea sp. PMI_226]|nr:hypothetical protein BGZ63DRAFT_420306 [Mariannaea sp. PMI_226]
MSSPPKVPFTITYKKPGTTPPLYLAGSFSDPQWQPKEMEYNSDKDGEYVFQSQVAVETGKNYQFKLRLGQGDWWVLSEDYPTATDASGNRNNILSVPRSQLHQDGDDGFPRDASIKDTSKQPMPTIEVQASKVEESGGDEADSLSTPLFAHECLGAYEFPDDESEEEIYPSIPMRRYMDSSIDHDETHIDTNDPTLEKFPSERGSILDALRTIQTHLNEDQAQLKDIPASPRVVSGGRHSSIDSSEDLSLSPVAISPCTTRRREQRQSHSSFRRSRSAVSLGSIAEEDTRHEDAKPDDADRGDISPRQLSPETAPYKAPIIINPNPAPTGKERQLPLGEEDEAVAMKSHMPAINGKDASQESKTAAKIPSDRVTEINLQASVHQVKVHSELSKDDEMGPKDFDPTLPPASASGESDGTLSSESSSPPAVEKSHIDVSKWLQVYLARVQQNKTRVIMAAGAVALAVAVRRWNGSEK